jgi:DeoR family transcriptional regulator, ulaG and ulaABCDEF operon transcriptional repressor
MEILSANHGWESHVVLERERHRMILKLLAARSIVSVTELAELLGASDTSIRRDINALADRGEVKRIRGGVEALHPRYEAHLTGVPFDMNQQIAVAQKRAIAHAASGLIAATDSIIITGGTTTYAMVEYLSDREIDILTNSFQIAAQLLATSRNRITLPGGTVFREQGLVLSPYPDNTIANFRANKLIVGCFGIGRFGLMETDPLIVHSTTAFLDRAEEIIVLADSRKLKQRSAMIVASLSRISTLVTDAEARVQDLDVLRSAGIKIIVAEPQNDQRQAQAG